MRKLRFSGAFAKGRRLNGEENPPSKDYKAGNRPEHSLGPSEIVSFRHLKLVSARFLPQILRPRRVGHYPDRKPDGPFDLGQQALVEQKLLWCGFAFAAGIVLYFSLPEEPSFLAVSGLFAASLFIAVRSFHRSGLGLAGTFALALLSGVFLANMRTLLVEAPRLAREVTLSFNGRVIDRDMGQRGPRLIVDVAGFDGDPGIPARDLPRRIRLAVPDNTGAGVGDAISARARLFPPAGPARPGGYDFSFRAYFKGISASGFAFGVPRKIDLGKPSWDLAAKRWLEDVRHGISARIVTLMGEGNAPALASALLVGDRSKLSEESEEVLRRAGLAHILAISGLHMALFAGGAYAAFLMLLSFSETASLNYRTHRIAAGAALVAAVCYLGLSGASVATQRSFIMVFLVFLGILTGRRGMTLRSVALAGLILLAAGPERLFYPGFQMSFAAVICLVAAYESWRKGAAGRLRISRSKSLSARAGASLLRWFFGLFLTALIAGTATGLVGAYHFGRIAPYGLIGNMLGMPVFSLAVMPMGVLALILMPFGLAALPLKAMGAGLDLLLSIATWTAGLESGSGTLAMPSAATTISAIIGLFSILLFSGKARAIGLVPLVLAGGVALVSRPPDIQLADRGGLVAARDQDGNLRVDARRSGFAVENWLQMEGVDESTFGEARMRAPQRRCDTDGCVYRAYPPSAGLMEEFGLSASAGSETGQVMPLMLAVPKTAAALAQDCRYADVIVTELVVPPNCRARMKISGKKRHDFGALSFWLKGRREPGHDKQTVYVSDWQGARTVPPRPWHR